MPVPGVSVPIVLIVISYIYTHASNSSKRLLPAARIMSLARPTNYADTAAQRNSIWAIGSGTVVWQGDLTTLL